MREQRGGKFLRVADEAMMELRVLSLQPNFRAARSAITSNRECEGTSDSAT
jgi:hypothetical protein